MFRSATPVVFFPQIGPVPLQVDFLSGRLTSDGGLPWLADAALEVTSRLAGTVEVQLRRTTREMLIIARGGKVTVRA